MDLIPNHDIIFDTIFRILIDDYSIIPDYIEGFDINTIKFKDIDNKHYYLTILNNKVYIYLFLENKNTMYLNYFNLQ